MQPIYSTGVYINLSDGMILCTELHTGSTERREVIDQPKAARLSVHDFPLECIRSYRYYNLYTGNNIYVCVYRCEYSLCIFTPSLNK